MSVARRDARTYGRPIQVNVITTPDVARDLRATPPLGIAATIAEHVARAGGQLFAQPDSLEQFVVEIEDEARGTRLVDELAGLEGVVSVYPQPPVSGA
jgi:hypothetical protein